MKKYIGGAIFNLFFALSAMEKSNMIKIARPSIVHRVLEENGFGIMDKKTELSTVIGDRLLSKVSALDYIKSALKEHNNLYKSKEVKLKEDADTVLALVESVSLRPYKVKSSKLIKIYAGL